MANVNEVIAKQQKRVAINKLVELSRKTQGNTQSSVPPIDLVIPHDVYQAFLELHGNAAVKEIVEQCRITIKSGAKVYFVTSYINAPRKINCVFETEADVDAWVAEMAAAS